MSNAMALRDLYKAAWRGDPSLHAAFSSPEDLANFMVDSALGINFVALRSKAITVWEKSAKLQAEFANAETYASYVRGCAEGRIRISKPKG